MLDRTEPTFSRQPATPSPMDAIVHAAGQKLLTLRMANLALDPDRDDFDNVMDDLNILIEIFDGVILELGKYAGSHFGITQSQVRDYFADQLRGALDGNATFVLEEAMSDLEQGRALHETSLWER